MNFGNHVFLTKNNEITLFLERKKKIVGYGCKKCGHNHIRTNKSVFIESIYQKHLIHLTKLFDTTLYLLDIVEEENGVFDIIYQHGLNGHDIRHYFFTSDLIPDCIVLKESLDFSPFSFTPKEKDL